MSSTTRLLSGISALLVIASLTTAMLHAAPTNTAASTANKAAANAAEPKLGPELLSNGSFATGGAPWILETHEGAQAELEILPKDYEGKPSATVNVEATQTDNKRWAVQLTQAGFKFKKGEKYRLSFAGKSSDGAWSFVTLGETVAPYGSVCAGSQIMLSQTWQKFSYDFVITQDAPEARVVFTNLNAGGQSRSFANISLKQLK